MTDDVVSLIRWLRKYSPFLLQGKIASTEFANAFHLHLAIPFEHEEFVVECIRVLPEKVRPEVIAALQTTLGPDFRMPSLFGLSVEEVESESKKATEHVQKWAFFLLESMRENRKLPV